MANVLSPTLLAAQENAVRYPLVEIKAGQFADDLPLAGQRLNAQTLDQTGAASILHSTGRLVAAYTQDEWDNAVYPARSVKLVYTDPERTGQGIGALLMDWAMAQFRAEGGDEVHLSVWSENFGAQRFYARYGFTKVADVVFMVGNHRDHDLLYARML